MILASWNRMKLLWCHMSVFNVRNSIWNNPTSKSVRLVVLTFKWYDINLVLFSDDQDINCMTKEPKTVAIIHYAHWCSFHPCLDDISINRTKFLDSFLERERETEREREREREHAFALFALEIFKRNSVQGTFFWPLSLLFVIIIT